MTDSAPEADRIVVPVHAESIAPVRREVDRGALRITTRVETEPTAWEATLRRDDVTIERAPIGVPVDAPPEPRWEGDTLIVPLVEEEIVVSRRLVLREELRITRRSEEERVSGSEPLRREVVDVERIDPTRAVDDGLD